MHSESRSNDVSPRQRGPRLSRREALRFLASATAIPLFQPGLSDPLTRGVSSASWQPEFLHPEDVDTVAALAGCFVPSTAAGERGSAAHEYIDLVLSRADAKVQRDFNDGLEWLDARVARSRNRRFADLGRAAQRQLLAEISDRSRFHEPRRYAFFTQIKQLAIDAYYRSDGFEV